MKKQIEWLVILLAVVSLAFNFFFYRQVAHFKKIEGKYRFPRAEPVVLCFAFTSTLYSEGFGENF